MTWVVDSSGTQTATGSGTEDTLATVTTVGEYCLSVDTNAMVNGDLTTIKIYDRVDGTNYRLAYSGTYQHVQICAAKESPIIYITSAIKVSITQSAGTGRAFEQLRWNSIFNLNLGLENAGFDGRHWVYFPEQEVCFFRIGYFHNFSSFSAPKGKQSLYAEVSYSGNKPAAKAALVKRIKGDLKKAGIRLRESQVLAQDINDITYGYPIYDKNYKAARGAIMSFLKKNDIVPCGRYGSWRYMSMEDSILDGKAAAEAAGSLK